MKYDTLKKRLERRIVVNGYGDYVSGLPVDAIQTGTRLVGCRIQENHGWRSYAARHGYAPIKSTSYYATPAMLAAWWREEVAPCAAAKRRDALFKIAPDAMAALPPEAVEFLDRLARQIDWGYDDAGNPAVLVEISNRKFLRCTCTGTGRAFLLRVPLGNVEGFPKNHIGTVADAVRWLTPDEIAKGAQAVQTA